MKCSADELRARREKLSSLYGEIRNIVLAIGTAPEDVEDLVHEIFIEAYNHIGKVKDMNCLNSWVYKIAYRKIIRFSMKRRKKISKEVFLDQEEWASIRMPDATSEGVFFIANRMLTDEELYIMVEALRPPAPVILDLRFKKGYTLKAISDMMGMNYNTVKTIEYRALAQLKNMILERRGEEDELQKTHY